MSELQSRETAHSMLNHGLRASQFGLVPEKGFYLAFYGKRAEFLPDEKEPFFKTSQGGGLIVFPKT